MMRTLIEQVHGTLSHLAVNNGSYLYVSTSEWARVLGVNRRHQLLPVFARLIKEDKIRLSKGRKARVVGGTIDMKSQRGLRVKVLELDLHLKPCPGLLSSDSTSHAGNTQPVSRQAAQSQSGNGRAGPDKDTSKDVNNQTNYVIWTGKHKQPPRRLDRVEQLYMNAEMVGEDELGRIRGVLERQYDQKFGYKWFGLRRKGDVTAARRILALCWMRRWDVEDYVDVNFTWFRERTRRRPVVSNISGERAEERYDEWLRKERYTDGENQTRGDRRAREVKCLRCKHEATESRRRRKRLYWQLINWLDKYLASYADKLRRNVKEVRINRPRWLLRTREQRLEWWVSKEVSLRRSLIIRRWWQRELETSSTTGSGCSACN